MSMKTIYGFLSGTCYSSADLHLRACDNNSILRLSPEEILYITASNNESRIVWEQGSRYVHHPLCQLEQILPDYFVRPHRSLLINPWQIRDIYPGMILFRNYQELTISKRKSKWLADYYQRFCHDNGTFVLLGQVKNWQSVCVPLPHEHK